MANHASHAALPYPIKNARFTVLVPYLDADGDPTDPTTPDTEVSKDDGAAADTAEEVATPKNSIGLLTLTGAETDCSCLGLAAKAASGPKTTLMTLYPRNLPVLASGTASAGAAGSITLASSITYDLTGCFVRTTGGTGGGGTGGANNQARRITAYNSGTQAATVSPNWETTPDNTTTYDILCPEGVTPGMLKALNPTTAGRTLDVSSGGEAGLDWANVGGATTSVSLTNTTVGTASVVGTVNGLAAGVITAAAISADAITAAKVAADVGAEIADAVWDEAIAGHLGAGSTGAALNSAGSAGDPWSTALPGAYGAGTAGKIVGDNLNATVSSRASQASLDTLDDYVDTEVAAIKAKTDSLTFTAAGKVDANLTHIGDAAITDTADQVAARFSDFFNRASAAFNVTTAVSTLDAAGVRSAVGLAAANLDTQLAAIDDYVDAEVAAIKAKTDQLAFTTAGRVDCQVFGMEANTLTAAAVASNAIDADALAADCANEIADALLDRAAGVETNRTLRQALRLILAACAGKLAGAATTTVTVRDTNDTKDRITATVDASGNRTAVTLDAT